MHVRKLNNKIKVGENLSSWKGKLFVIWRKTGSAKLYFLVYLCVCSLSLKSQEGYYRKYNTICQHSDLSQAIRKAITSALWSRQ
jgi:hypothetical protein